MKAAFVLALALAGCVPPGLSSYLPSPSPLPSFGPAISRPYRSNPTAYGTAEFQWVNNSAATLWPATEGEFDCWVTDRPPYPILAGGTGPVIHLIYNPASCRNGIIPFQTTYHAGGVAQVSPVCRLVVRYRQQRYTFHLHFKKGGRRCSMVGTSRKVISIY